MTRNECVVAGNAVHYVCMSMYMYKKRVLSGEQSIEVGDKSFLRRARLVAPDGLVALVSNSRPARGPLLVDFSRSEAVPAHAPALTPRARGHQLEARRGAAPQKTAAISPKRVQARPVRGGLARAPLPARERERSKCRDKEREDGKSRQTRWMHDKKDI